MALGPRNLFLVNCVEELLVANDDGLSVNWLSWKLRTTEEDIVAIVRTLEKLHITKDGNVEWR